MQIWIREHNRLCTVIGDSLSGQEAFDLAQATVKAKWQKIILDEFLPALGISQATLQAYAATTPPNRDTEQISMEFSIGYRYAPFPVTVSPNNSYLFRGHKPG